jgi:serine/threonine protein kinase
VRLEDPGSALRRLPRGEQEWLADGAFRLITPMIASDRSVVGLIALGEKKSELPFSQEDRLLLNALAVSAAPKLEMFVARSRSLAREAIPEAAEPLSDAARECRRCNLVFGSQIAACTGCGGPLVVAPIPTLLAGKFTVDRRIGSGSMGVVYAARDMELGRPVAIKTLPKMSPSQAFSLRQEARTLGAVTHPNLITIFGAETWRGRPLLIFEFLSGGTLATKLASGPLPIVEAVDLGILLSSALDRIHHIGVLHRDIKPTNIGFESWGTPKLLDFGLAHIVGTTDWDDASRDVIVGTPAYLSPEAAAGQPADVGTDLWQLSMVIYESVTGSNPMRRDTVAATLEAVRKGVVPAAGSVCPDCPLAVAEFLSEALHHDPRRRPRTAGVLHGRLQRLKLALAADESSTLNVA